MSWSYDYFNVSGYSTGDTGIQINEGIYLQVSGLKYDGITFNNTHLEWLTGIGFITSGNISTPVSGSFIFNSDLDHWQASLSITDPAEVGNTGAGTYEFYWNSGGAYSDSDVSTGMWIWANAGADRWDMITDANSSVDNADTQHTHAAGADDLGDHEATQMLDMNSFKITGLANGIASTDAMALGQKYTLESHNNTYHSTNYEVANANIQSHVATPVTDAHHAVVVAGDLSHNSLDGLNADTTYEHITQTQKNALHTILDGYTKVEIDGHAHYDNVGFHVSAGATDIGYVLLTDAIGERVGTTISTGPNWDDSKDIVITASWERQDANNDTVAFKITARVHPYDTSEDVNIWNLDNFTNIFLPASADNKGQHYDYTVDAADWDAGDVIVLFFEHNEASRGVYWNVSVLVKYYEVI